MSKIKFSKGQWLAFASLFISVAVYVIERAFKRFVPWNEKTALVQAIVYVALCLAVYLLIVKSKEVYFGIISALLAIKLIPPELSMLKLYNTDAYFVYYIFGKFALVLFIYAIYQLYKSQEKKEIRPIPVFAIIVTAPFIMEIAGVISKYAYFKTGSMMLPYAAQAGCYILAMAALGLLALIIGGKNGTMICDFNIICFIINMARKAFSMLVLTHAHMHVSKSYICWIVIYAALIVAYVLVRKRITTAKEIAVKN